MIAKVVATRGSNQFDVLVSSHETTPQLAILPSKFHKLIWVKRGDYCIVETGEETQDTNSGVRFIITHILYKDQIKHLKAKKLWPSSKEFETNEEEAGEDEEKNDDDGIVFDTAVTDNEYFVNTNRINAMQIQDSSSDSESSNGDIQQNETDDVIEFDTQDDELFANTNRVAALRIQESESDSSVEKGDELQRQEGSLQRGESIEFDTGNYRNMSRLTAMQMREEGNVGRGESIEFDTGKYARSMSDGLIYDTADAEEVNEPEGESDDDDEDSIHQNETDDGLVFDTANADEVDPDAKEVSDDSDDEKVDITKTETDDGVEFDTANDAKQESEHDVV